MARTHFFPFTPSTSTDLRPSVCQHPFSLADHRATKRVKKRGSSQPRHANVNSRQIPVDRSLRDLVFFPHAAPYIRTYNTDTQCKVQILTCICIRSPLFVRLSRLLGRDKCPLPDDPPVTRRCVSKNRRSLHRLLYSVLLYR